MEPTRPGERLVEQSLRELLVPLDRHLERGRSLLAAALVLAPAPYILLWLLGWMEAKHSAGWAVLTFVVLVVTGLGWETLMDRLVRWRFDRRFPDGSPSRDAALHLLGQIETPNKVEEKLREALAPAGLGRGRRRSDRDLAPPHEPLPLLELPPQTRPLEMPAVAPVGPRPGGCYDYIPLEPLSGDEEFRSPKRERGE